MSNEKKAILIIDTFGGLCNQMLDIKSAVIFAIANEYCFCFRHCSLRNPDLTSWRPALFETLFDEELFRDLPGYLNYNEISTRDSVIWNAATKRVIELLKSDAEIAPIAAKHDFLVLNQFWPIFNWSSSHLTIIPKILPAKKIKIKFEQLRVNLPPEYNFLHYRYEFDFVNHFIKIDSHISFPKLQIILDSKLFSRPNLPIYIAASSLAALDKSHLKIGINKLDNIIYTDETKINNFNYEAAAYLDFLIGENSNEIFGHSRSSFSQALNIQKNTANYYDLLLA